MYLDVVFDDGGSDGVSSSTMVRKVSEYRHPALLRLPEALLVLYESLIFNDSTTLFIELLEERIQCLQGHFAVIFESPFDSVDLSLNVRAGNSPFGVDQPTEMLKRLKGSWDTHVGASEIRKVVAAQGF